MAGAGIRGGVHSTLLYQIETAVGNIWRSLLMAPVKARLSPMPLNKSATTKLAGSGRCSRAALTAAVLSLPTEPFLLALPSTTGAAPTADATAVLPRDELAVLPRDTFAGGDGDC